MPSIDIRIKTTMLQHPKVQKLKRKLGADGVLGFISLLCFCGEYKTDGQLSGMDNDDIAIASGYNGDTDEYVDTLLSLHLLDNNCDVITIHDWHEHNPYVSGSGDRSEQARKAANAKWGSGYNNSQSEGKAKRSERLSEARIKGRHTKDQWNNMLNFFGECVRCGEKDKSLLVKDHILPIYQGGSDGIDNIQPLCVHCNASKGAENIDHRISWCNKKRLQMPAEFFGTPANACETPAPSPSPDPSPYPKKNTNPVNARPTFNDVCEENSIKGYEQSDDVLREFIAHYDSVDWKTSGGTQIVNWRAAFQKWIIKQHQYDKQKSGRDSPTKVQKQKFGDDGLTDAMREFANG